MQKPILWAAAVAGFCIGISLAAHPGIPAYRHDWQWPVDSASLGAWFWSKLEAWNWQGLGQPNIAIQVHPFFAVSALAALVLSSKAILAGWLTTAAAVSAAGAAAFVITRFEVRPFPAIVTGVLYGLSPFVVNETVAGHIAYLLAYAGVPWLLIATASRHRAALWAFGFGLAWIGLQIQVLLLAVLLALTAAMGQFRARNLLTVPLAVGTMLPYAWALFRPEAAQVTTLMHTSIPWEVVQSVPLSRAILGVGYFAGYWESASASAFWSAVVPWLYLIGIALALTVRRSAGMWGLGACYVLGVLLLSGLKGPLAGLLSWSFVHVSEASAFRELYGAAILLTFAGAVGAGVALDAFPNKNVHAAAALMIVTVSVAPWLSGGVLKQTASAFSTPAVERRAGEIANSPYPSRFYLAPGANPVGPSGSSIGGADPAAYDVNHVSPFWAYLVYRQEGAVIWAIEGGGQQAAGIAKSLGISAMLMQPNLSTKFVGLSMPGNSLHIHEFSGALPNIPGWNAGSKISDNVLIPIVSGVGGPSILRLIPRELESDAASQPRNDAFIEAVHGLPIDRGWVPAQDWWFLSDRVAQAAPHGVITSAHDAALPLRCVEGRSTAELFATGNGRVGDSVITILGWRKLRLSCGGNTRVSAAANGYIVLTSAGDLAAWSSMIMLGRMPDALLQVTKRGDELAAKPTSDCRRCTIVLSEKASPGWTLSIGRESIPATVLPSGFCAWRVDLSKGQAIRIAYEPARRAIFLEWCAAACWMWLGSALAFSIIRRPSLSKRTRLRPS